MKSPIETMLRNAIVSQVDGVASHGVMLFDYSSASGPFVADVGEEGVDGIIRPENACSTLHGNKYGAWCFSLYQSVSIDRYRADFVIWVDYGMVPLAIECDGHEWHERTKQQASADRARDREFLKLGVTTVRFTGSDIYHDADGCAVDIIRIAKRLSGSSFFSGYNHGHTDALKSRPVQITKADI